MLKFSQYKLRPEDKEAIIQEIECFLMEEVKKNRPFKEITINGKVFKALLDTGADVSSSWKKIDLQIGTLHLLPSHFMV